MKNPSRDIPRVVHTALPTVIGIALKLSNDSLVFPGECRVLCSTSDRRSLMVILIYLVLTQGFWSGYDWILNWGETLCAVCDSIMLWSHKRCHLYDCAVDSCSRERTSSSINFWNCTSEVPDACSCLILAWHSYFNVPRTRKLWGPCCLEWNGRMLMVLCKSFPISRFFRPPWPGFWCWGVKNQNCQGVPSEADGMLTLDHTKSSLLRLLYFAGPCWFWFSSAFSRRPFKLPLQFSSSSQAFLFITRLFPAGQHFLAYVLFRSEVLNEDFHGFDLLSRRHFGNWTPI